MYRINSYRIARVYLYFVMNIVDISHGTRRTVLTKTLVKQLVDICGDMWRVITRANSSHIVGKLVTVGQGLIMIAQPLFRLTWLETLKTGILATQLKLFTFYINLTGLKKR